VTFVCFRFSFVIAVSPASGATSAISVLSRSRYVIAVIPASGATSVIIV
jgi:hypothetical protein